MFHLRSGYKYDFVSVLLFSADTCYHGHRYRFSSLPQRGSLAVLPHTSQCSGEQLTSSCVLCPTMMLQIVSFPRKKTTNSSSNVLGKQTRAEPVVRVCSAPRAADNRVDRSGRVSSRSTAAWNIFLSWSRKRHHLCPGGSTRAPGRTR